MTSSMQCEHDENMMMSCLCHPHVKQPMMMWCSCNMNTNDVMPPDSYVALTEKNPKWAQQGHKVTQCWHKTLFWVPC